ncbi:MAG TPA: response regulator transcription factor [Acidimicrobiales bacterium]
MSGEIKVMVVDDTAHVRSMLTAMLELDGFQVVGEAADGESALALLDDTNPDVVVVDFKMPGIDGLETTRRMVSKRPDQIVILYTAFLDDDLERQAKEAGATVCLAKVAGLANLELEIRNQCESLF